MLPRLWHVFPVGSVTLEGFVGSGIVSSSGVNKTYFLPSGNVVFVCALDGDSAVTPLDTS